jgi:hypothetical protein
MYCPCIIIFFHLLFISFTVSALYPLLVNFYAFSSLYGCLEADDFFAKDRSDLCVFEVYSSSSTGKKLKSKKNRVTLRGV